MNFFNNLRGGLCFESLRTSDNIGGKIYMFNLSHTVFDGGIRWGMFTQCLCQNGANFLRSFALQQKNLRLDVVKMTRVA